MPLIKNPKGVIVSVPADRKAYLLNENPVALNIHGKPKTDANGNTFPIKKAENEKGWKEVTKAEADAYNEQLEEDQIAAEEATNATEAAGMVAVAAALATKKAGSAQERAANSRTKKNSAKKPIVKTEEEQTQDDADAAAKLKIESEGRVRDAEGDAAKYDALTDEEKALYIELFEGAPEGSK